MKPLSYESGLFVRMINVKVRNNQISLTGHAGIAPAGSDVACAGVSALTLTLVRGLQEIACMELTGSQTKGNMVIEWQHMNEIGRALIDTWFLGICEISQHYGCIRYV